MSFSFSFQLAAKESLGYQLFQSAPAPYELPPLEIVDEAGDQTGFHEYVEFTTSDVYMCICVCFFIFVIRLPIIQNANNGSFM